MAKLGMAIQLDRCIGCGVCAIACKSENNTEHKQGGTTFNWLDYLTFSGGTFSGGDVHFKVYPVQCNHCSDPACLYACPNEAIYKTADGITMIDENKCTGLGLCMDACPYSNRDVDADQVQYSVLSLNGETPNEFWNNNTEIIAGATSSPSEVATNIGSIPPTQNEYTHNDYNAVRGANKIEKCYFCDHRLKVGEEPYCVESCPTDARVFGDVDDPTSEISQLLDTYGYHRLKNNSGEFLGIGENGTDPNVYYIGKFGTGPGPSLVEEIEKPVVLPLSLHPNPVSKNVTIEFEVKSASTVSLSIYDITGKQVAQVVNNERKETGKYKITTNVSGLQGGTYICVYLVGKHAASTKFVVTK